MALSGQRTGEAPFIVVAERFLALLEMTDIYASFRTAIAGGILNDCGVMIYRDKRLEVSFRPNTLRDYERKNKKILWFVFNDFLL